MPKNKNASISKNLTVSLVLMVLAVSVIPVGINYVHSSRKAKAQLEEKADEYITFLVNSLEMPLWLLDDKSIQNIGRFFANNELVAELKITDYDNRVLFDIRKNNNDDVITKEKTVFFNNKGASGNIRLSLSYRYYRQLSNNLLLTSFITIIVILIFLTSATSFLLRVFLRKPLAQLNDIAKAYAAGKYESSEYQNFYDEFKPFVIVLGKMEKEIRSRIKELRDAEKKYRDIVENAIEGIFQTTPGGQIISVNPALVNMMGYDSQDDMLLSVSDISNQFYVNTADREVFVRILNQDSKIIGFETQMQRKDKILIMVSISARTVRDEQGNILYYEGSLTDITERIRREKAEREREIADAANQTKSRFLAHISHELRTPLNAIIGYAQILDRTPYATQFQKERLDIIQKSGEHLLMLLNDILDLSKIEAGCVDIRPVEFCLPDFLSTLMAMFQVRAFHKNILFDYELSDFLPKIVKGDEIRLRQILINLLGNAVKFTEKGCVFFKTDYHNGRVFFEITDTGLGIDADEHEKIFDPFHQSGSALKKSEGTGLGLSISRKLVEMMGGELTVQSTPGQGSVFRVSLEMPAAEWIYQESASAEKISDETTALMVPPSESELEELIRFAKLGDIAFIRQKAEALLRQKDTQMTAFAKKLLQLARGFHIDKIRLFLKSF